MRRRAAYQTVAEAAAAAAFFRIQREVGSCSQPTLFRSHQS